MAIQGHDYEREQFFFAMEIRSARFASDWPLPLSRPRLTQADVESQRTYLTTHKGWKRIPFIFWRSSGWAGFFRFWTGLAYGFLSDFGRSLARPLLFWGFVTLNATAFFLNQSASSQIGQAPELRTWWNLPKQYALWTTAPLRTHPPCSTGMSDHDKAVWPLLNNGDASIEALQLALQNGLLFLGRSEDEINKSYACLYGIESLGDRTIPVVPSTVAFASLVQKLLSGIAIFLFGLALRNMLRLR